MVTITEGYESEKSKKERELEKQFDEREQKRQKIKIKKALCCICLVPIIALVFLNVYYPATFEIAIPVIALGMIVGIVLFIMVTEATQDLALGLLWMFGFILCASVASIPFAIFCSYMGYNPFM